MRKKHINLKQYCNMIKFRRFLRKYMNNEVPKHYLMREFKHFDKIIVPINQTLTNK